MVESMHLKVLLPSQTFVDTTGVIRLVAETSQGSIGFLPHRLDCVAALSPGILTYETAAGGEVFIAVDEGVLVKAGFEVMISVRRALSGKDLSKLHALVKQEFLILDEHEREVRSTMAKLETGFVGRLASFSHE